MDATLRSQFLEHLEIFRCPRCRAALELGDEEFKCTGCSQAFPTEDNIPLLFWPNDWDESQGDVTDQVREFYEETPFPNYDEFDSVGSLIEKARKGLFAKMLDDQVPAGTRVLEVGCGTGQLCNFLSIANRTVFGADLCLNSLRLGQHFKEQNHLANIRFLQVNLFRPPFAEQSFDLVISNGVLHHTSNPKLAYEGLSRLVKPGATSSSGSTTATAGSSPTRGA